MIFKIKFIIFLLLCVLTAQDNSGAEYRRSAIHNGNLVNTEKIKKELQDSGALFQTSTDTELIIHLLAREKGDSLSERLEKALLKLEGAYSLILLTPSEIIVARDQYGIRPFCIGKLNETYTLEYVKRRHQYSESECGMYSLYFIIQLLKDRPMAMFQKQSIKDERMQRLRKLYFNN